MDIDVNVQSDCDEAAVREELQAAKKQLSIAEASLLESDSLRKGTLQKIEILQQSVGIARKEVEALQAEYVAVLNMIEKNDRTAIRSAGVAAPSSNDAAGSASNGPAANRSNKTKAALAAGKSSKAAGKAAAIRRDHTPAPAPVPRAALGTGVLLMSDAALIERYILEHARASLGPENPAWRVLSMRCAIDFALAERGAALSSQVLPMGEILRSEALFPPKGSGSSTSTDKRGDGSPSVSAGGSSEPRMTWARGMGSLLPMPIAHEERSSSIAAADGRKRLLSAVDAPAPALPRGRRRVEPFELPPERTGGAHTYLDTALCPYEMNGVCNDDACQYLHAREISSSERADSRDLSVLGGSTVAAEDKSHVESSDKRPRTGDTDEAAVLAAAGKKSWSGVAADGDEHLPEQRLPVAGQLDAALVQRSDRRAAASKGPLAAAHEATDFAAAHDDGDVEMGDAAAAVAGASGAVEGGGVLDGDADDGFLAFDEADLMEEDESEERGSLNGGESEDELTAEGRLAVQQQLNGGGFDEVAARAAVEACLHGVLPGLPLHGGLVTTSGAGAATRYFVGGVLKAASDEDGATSSAVKAAATTRGKKRLSKRELELLERYVEAVPGDVDAWLVLAAHRLPAGSAEAFHDLESEETSAGDGATGGASVLQRYVGAARHHVGGGGGSSDRRDGGESLAVADPFSPALRLLSRAFECEDNCSSEALWLAYLTVLRASSSASPRAKSDMADHAVQRLPLSSRVWRLAQALRPAARTVADELKELRERQRVILEVSEPIGPQLETAVSGATARTTAASCLAGTVLALVQALAQAGTPEQAEKVFAAALGWRPPFPLGGFGESHAVDFQTATVLSWATARERLLLWYAYLHLMALGVVPAHVCALLAQALPLHADDEVSFGLLCWPKQLCEQEGLLTQRIKEHAGLADTIRAGSEAAAAEVGVTMGAPPPEAGSWLADLAEAAAGSRDSARALLAPLMHNLALLARAAAAPGDGAAAYLAACRHGLAVVARCDSVLLLPLLRVQPPADTLGPNKLSLEGFVQALMPALHRHDAGALITLFVLVADAAAVAIPPSRVPEAAASALRVALKAYWLAEADELTSGCRAAAGVLRSASDWQRRIGEKARQEAHAWRAEEAVAAQDDSSGRVNVGAEQALFLTLCCCSGVSAARDFVDHLLTAEAFVRLPAQRRRALWLVLLEEAAAAAAEAAAAGEASDSQQANDRCRKVLLVALEDDMTSSIGHLPQEKHASSVEEWTREALAKAHTAPELRQPSAAAALNGVFHSELLSRYSSSRIGRGADWLVAAAIHESKRTQRSSAAALAIACWLQPSYTPVEALADATAAAVTTSEASAAMTRRFARSALPLLLGASSRYHGDASAAVLAAAAAEMAGATAQAQRVLEAAVARLPRCSLLWERLIALEARHGGGDEDRAERLSAAASSIGVVLALERGG